MDAFLALPDDRRRILCEEAGRILGLDAPSVEKDFWVCWVLRELFTLPESGPHLTFKGGTSLSKGWQLIERFSEDIDVVVDREFLGFGGGQSPESAPNNKQRTQRLEELRAACQRHIREVMAPALTARIERALPKSLSAGIEHDAGDPDGQTLLFAYPHVLGGDGYIRPVVRIELGARSDADPSMNPSIRPYLAEALPDELGESVFTVRTLAPERTFWEKASLLHEETYRAGDKGPATRMARHYYDLWCLIRGGVADRALADPELFQRVITHRLTFFRRSKAAQDSLRPGSLRLVPTDDKHAAWRQDYQAMRETMFFGDTPEFDEILRVVGDFERRFNAAGGASS